MISELVIKSATMLEKPFEQRFPLLRLKRSDHSVHKVVGQRYAARADLAPGVLLINLAVPGGYDVGWLPTPGFKEEPLLRSIDDLSTRKSCAHTLGQTVWLHTSCMWDMGGVGTKRFISAVGTLEAA